MSTEVWSVRIRTDAPPSTSCCTSLTGDNESSVAGESMSVVVAVSNVVRGAATVGHDCTDRGARCHHGGTMTRPLWALFLLVSWLPFTIALLDFHLLILDFGDLLFHRSAPRFQKLANYRGGPTKLNPGSGRRCIPARTGPGRPNGGCSWLIRTLSVP